MKLARPPASYDEIDQAQMRGSIEREDEQNLKRGRDIDLGSVKVKIGGGSAGTTEYGLWVLSNIAVKSGVSGSGWSVLDARGLSGVSGFLGAFNSSGTRIGYSTFYDGSLFWGAKTDGATPLAFGTNGTEAMRIAAAGELRIGATAAVAGEHVLIAFPAGQNGVTIQNASSASGVGMMNFVWGASSVVGNIVTTASSCAFNSLSDETHKTRQGYLAAAEAARIIRADPTWDFTWKVDGSQAYGWGAQTSYAVRPELASPGGWYDAEGAPCEETDQGATYRPWGVDQGKRTPYLWAAIGAEGGILDRLAALEAGQLTLSDEITGQLYRLKVSGGALSIEAYP